MEIPLLEDIYKEYKEIVRDKVPVTFVDGATSPNNTAKNRYGDVLPLASTSVKLSSIDGVEDSDYINANLVYDDMNNELTKKQKYICCQAPLLTTFDDFWRMVWEQKVPIIVMITNLIEKNRVKADRYWPNRIGQVVRFGNICVKLVKEQVQSKSITVRSFRIWVKPIIKIVCDDDIDADIEDPNSRTPSDSAPSIDIDSIEDDSCDNDHNTSSIIQLGEHLSPETLRLSKNKSHPSPTSNPNNNNNNNYININNKDEETLEPLIFKINIKDESDKSPKNNNNNNNNDNHVTATKSNHKIVTPRISLQNLINSNSSGGGGGDHLNSSDPNHLKASCRNSISHLVQSQKITYEKNYRRDQADSDSQVSEQSEGGKVQQEEDEISFEIEDYDSFSRDSSSTEEEVPQEEEEGEVREITHLHCTNWPDFGIPDSTQEMINLINELDIRKKSLDDPVVVHCSAGIGRTGTFVAIHVCLNRHLLGLDSDIKKIVKHLRTQRLGMVQSKEQYSFVYSVTRDIIDSKKHQQTNIGSEATKNNKNKKKKDPEADITISKPGEYKAPTSKTKDKLNNSNSAVNKGNSLPKLRQSDFV